MESSLHQILHILSVISFEKTPFCSHFRHPTPNLIYPI
jgi:hypothetical protein